MVSPNQASHHKSPPHRQTSQTSQGSHNPSETSSEHAATPPIPQHRAFYAQFELVENQRNALAAAETRRRLEISQGLLQQERTFLGDTPAAPRHRVADEQPTDMARGEGGEIASTATERCGGPRSGAATPDHDVRVGAAVVHEVLGAESGSPSVDAVHASAQTDAETAIALALAGLAVARRKAAGADLPPRGVGSGGLQRGVVDEGIGEDVVGEGEEKGDMGEEGRKGGVSLG
ncbi:hypothetical protein LTR50_004133 [Elasticomyces elasticus]|nr:hypothetical protein LTR50_004133 [Elasticomyces elasticus]